MVTEFYAFEMLTGRRLTPLPAASGSWKVTTNADDQIRCSIPARAIDTAKLRIWETTTLARTGLLAVEDGVPVAAGPLWKRRYTQGDSIELTAGGMFSYFDRRVALPATTRDKLLHFADGRPYPPYNLVFTNWSLGTIAKKLVAEALAWPGGNLPIVLPDDIAGMHERTYVAVELDIIGDLLRNLTKVIGGPDIDFRPRWSADGLGIYWEMVTGTDDVPRIGQTDPSLVRWTVGAPSGSAHGITVDEDGTDLLEEVWATGGGRSDTVLIRAGRRVALNSAGFPLLQGVDTSHTNVSDSDTLNDYAEQGAHLGQFPSSFWSMSVRKHEKATIPLGDWWKGDKVTLTVDPAEPVLGRDVAYDVVRRVAAIGGQLGSDSYDLTFAEEIG